MNVPQFSRTLIFTFFVSALMVSQFTSRAATLSWVTGSGNSDWSNTTHWSGATVSNGDSVVFGIDGRQSNSTTVNNLVNSAYLPPNGLTLNSLTYQVVDLDASNQRWQNTGIDTGVTLTTAALTVGADGASSTQLTNSRVTLSGGGTLNVTNTAGTIQIGAKYNSSSLDMSGLANFNASMSGASTFRIGLADSSTAATASSVILAQNSSIAAKTLSIGADSGAGSGGAYSLKLGSVANTLNVETINVGAGPTNDVTALRASGSLTFNESSGSVTIRGASGGTSRADLNLLNTNSSSAQLTTAVVDLSGHSADVRLGVLTMSRRYNANIQSGGANSASTFSFDTGTLDISSVNMAYLENTAPTTNVVTATMNLGSTGSTGTSTIGSMALSTNLDDSATSVTTATLNVAGGTHSVTNNIVMSTTNPAASGTYNGVANSVINLTGGTLTVGGDILVGGGRGVENATITLNGGTLDMTNGNIGTSGNAINSLNFQSGTLRNVASINGTAGLTKTTGGTLILEGTNAYTGSTVVSGGTLIVNGSKTGSGTVTVNAGTTLGGSGSIAGATTISGTHTPGNSPGLQTFGSTLTYNNGSSVTWELTGNTDSGRGVAFDAIDVAGDLTVNLTSTINLVFNVGSTVVWADAFWDTNRSWLFYDVAGTRTGTFTLGTVGLDSVGQSLSAGRGSFSITYSGSDVLISYAAVPEPNTWLLLAGAGMALFFRRRVR